MNLKPFGQPRAIGIDIGTSGVRAVADKLDSSSVLAQTGVQPMFRRLRSRSKCGRHNSHLVICSDLSFGMERTGTSSCYPPFLFDGA